MTSAALDELAQALARRRSEGLERVRRTVGSAQGPRLSVDGRELLAFARNDYLGLAGAPELVDAACDGARRYGVGAGASHLVTGHGEAHAALEAELAAFVRPCEGARALLFSSGYLANLAILTALAGRSDAIFGDRLNHACLNDGAFLSRATFERYAHGDTAALEARLDATRARRRIIATDAVFSMDGDLAPLAALADIASRHDAWLVVDDAHGFGVLGNGRGSLAECGLTGERIVYMGTLGKAAGVAGAFVAAHPVVIETLIQTARSYIYTTAAPPLTAAVLRTSLALIAAGDARRARLAELIAAFRREACELPWKLLPSRTPIQPLVLGDAATAVAVSSALQERGVLVPAIRPPTVPAGTARLRVSLSAAHTPDDVAALCDALRAVAKEFGA
jgi:8-amino-7-oxononanoate synthase